jgi:SHS2 domain-containing protein
MKLKKKLKRETTIINSILKEKNADGWKAQVVVDI